MTEAVETSVVLEPILDVDGSLVGVGFGRFARGEAGREGASWVGAVVVMSLGGGVVSFAAGIVPYELLN